jgi:hypothetical protein
VEYRKRTDGAVLSELELKNTYPETSFPRPMTAAAANEFGFDVVLEGAQPTPSGVYESVVRKGVAEKDGVYYTNYEIVTATGDAATTIDDKKAEQNRSQRNTLLAECDYTQSADKGGLTDSKVTEWATYRQSLRDLPTASGWPHTVTWPTKPS